MLIDPNRPEEHKLPLQLVYCLFNGSVSLDLALNCSFTRSYGPEPIIGLPATMTQGTYNMTDTITDDAELRFCNSDALDSVLRESPGFMHTAAGHSTE